MSLIFNDVKEVIPFMTIFPRDVVLGEGSQIDGDLDSPTT
jgi:hypothetical protein